MKKAIAILLSAAFLLTSFSGCSPKKHPDKDDGKLMVVTTIFPLYDWAVEIIGDQAEHVHLVCLLENGADYHSFQPSASDIVRITEADVFLFTGGGSESWAEEALKNSRNPGQKVVSLFSVLSDRLLLEEHVEGMEEEEHGEGNAVEYDEHLYLSLVNAKRAVEAIRDALSKADPAHRNSYSENAAAYLEKLSALDESYRDAVRTAGRNIILFGDRFPFRYLTEDYGLRYYAAFQGCSADSEASFATVAFLAEKVKELALPAVLALEKSDHKLAETIISASGVPETEILTMDSMQAVTPQDRAQGASYLGSMEKNLETLRKALN
ncbi:MAG: zinc ABC transporter substrate-binding protein [Lachnospiraceae bacterium]|nr:zinc ABC transporter substrate-binding protein [Lachnospiraceae bacterium]